MTLHVGVGRAVTEAALFRGESGWNRGECGRAPSARSRGEERHTAAEWESSSSG